LVLAVAHRRLEFKCVRGFAAGPQRRGKSDLGLPRAVRAKVAKGNVDFAIREVLEQDFARAIDDDRFCVRSRFELFYERCSLRIACRICIGKADFERMVACYAADVSAGSRGSALHADTNAKPASKIFSWPSKREADGHVSWRDDQPGAAAPIR
jgi:hypothetical protein